MDDDKVPTAHELHEMRFRSQALVAASRRGEVSFDEARAACIEYIDMAYRRQRALYGRVRMKISLSGLLR